MGAASKGIIQRGFQHNATVYKAPYAKNPFDNVTDDELNEYKRTVERKKKSIHGECKLQLRNKLYMYIVNLCNIHRYRYGLLGIRGT